MKDRLRIGFVAARLSGTDGVSLETRKWIEVLKRLGCECFAFCSRSDWPSDRVMLSEEASFTHEDVRAIQGELFGNGSRTDATARRVDRLKRRLKEQLGAFRGQFGIELLIVENALALPMHVPLGLAITEFIAESQIPTIAHHHDFWWERDRYVGSPADDYLRAAFPPTLAPIRHVVINSVAERELAYRTGAKSALIPNVMDFDGGPEDEEDEYAADLRESIGVREGERLLLQPTRVVPRKRIEKGIELVRRLNADCALVVTHDAGDEGEDYPAYLRELAGLLDVRLLTPAERFGVAPGRTDAGEKIYALKDAYRNADLVAYTSSLEGFGNAFLETIYHKRPMLMSAYEIFQFDICPKGFKVLCFQNFMSRELVNQVESLLNEPDRACEWCEHNFALGKRYYSFDALERKLAHTIDQAVDRD